MAHEARSRSLDELLVHADFLVNLARRLVSDEATANDVVQEAWLRALQAPPRVGGSPRGWFARVVRNLVHDRRSGERARHERERRVAHPAIRGAGSAPGDASPAPEESMDRRMSAVDELGRAFAGLPEVYREALYLRYFDDLEPPAIAERLGVPLPTAKTRLRRGLKLLRDDLERRLGPDGQFALLLVPLAGRTKTMLPASAAPAAGGVSLLFHVAPAAGVLLLGTLVWRYGSVAPSAATLQGASPEAPAGPELQPGSARVAGAPRGAGATLASLPAARGPQERRALDASLVSGRIVYESTGQGVPFYGFELRDPQADDAAPRWLVTDGEGHFQLEQPIPERLGLTFPGSSLRVPPAGQDPEPGARPARGVASPAGAGATARIAVASGGAAPGGARPGDSSARRAGPDAGDERLIDRAQLTRPLGVAVGPTYFLDFEPPQGYGHADFEAVIVGYPFESLHVRRNWAPVSTGDRPWVRFHEPQPEVYTEPWTWHVELLSRDGAWMGRAPVEWVRGVRETSLRVDLVPHTVLSGVVRSRSGEPLLLRLGLQEPGGARTHLRFTDAEGGFRFECLEPGEYTLFARYPHMLPWSEPVLLTPGDQEREIVLEPRPAGGRVEGRITSTSGSFAGKTFLYMEGRGDQSAWRRHDVRWREENGALVADFSFDVAHGTYRLVCNTVDGVRVAERVRSVTPPLSGVDFLVEDDLPELRIAPHVVTPTGEVLDEFTLLTKVEGGYLDQRVMKAGQVCPRRIHAGVELEWWIVADGFRPAHGDPFDLSADGELEVRLEPGFGAVVHTLDISSYSSLSGVSVLADGVEVGLTDDAGDLVLDLPARPERLAVDPARWHIYSDGGRRSSIDPQTGAYEPTEGVVLAAYLRRVE